MTIFTSLRSRLFIINLGLILVGFGGLTLWSGQQMGRMVWSEYGNGQIVYTILLANQLVDPLEENPSKVRPILIQSAENLAADLALFNSQGQPIYQTNQSMTLVPTGAYQVSDGRVQSSAEIRYENSLIGYVQIATSATVPQATIRQQWRNLAIAFLAFSGAGALITLWLLNSLTEPLARLRTSALKIAEGALDHRIDNLPANEIGAVGTAFNTMSERISALIDEQRAFASNASHELRTPLTTIRLRTEAIQMGVEAEVQARYISEIDSEAHRMSQLVDDLLLLSRIEAHRLEIGSELIDVGRLLQALARDIAPQVAEKRIAWSLRLPDEPMIVVATLNHLQIIFRNVIDNALKYTPEGGCVSVEVERKGALIVVRVIDNGRGISAENLPHIGKRFYRTDKSRNRQTPGTGLGLALTQSILALYGGTLTIHSDGLDQGCSVTVVLQADTHTSDR